MDRALGHVAARWGGEAVRRRNTLAFPAAGRLVHAVGGTRVSLIGRFTFHVEPATYARLAASPDGWLALVPTEGERFLLVPFRGIVWPRHQGDDARKVKWFGMRL